MTLCCREQDLDDGQQMPPDHQEHFGSVSSVVSYIHVHRR